MQVHGRLRALFRSRLVALFAVAVLLAFYIWFVGRQGGGADGEGGGAAVEGDVGSIPDTLPEGGSRPAAGLQGEAGSQPEAGLQAGVGCQPHDGHSHPEKHRRKDHRSKSHRDSYASTDDLSKDPTPDFRPISVEEVNYRCTGTTGGWCQAFLTQTPLPTKAPPRGNRSCLNYCNGAGICNWDTGLCDCTAGYYGDYCQYRQKRACTNAWRSAGAEATSSKTKLESGWTASLCLGVCDEDVAVCYCNGTYGRVPAPPDEMPLWAEPIRNGRPLTLHCIAKLNDIGEPVAGGRVDNAELWSGQGWCMADKPQTTCPCIHDGWTGNFCEIAHEKFCINQCSGQGDCRDGFCRCRDGYYGHDCARRVSGTPELPNDIEAKKPWLAGVMVPPVAAEDPPRQPKRLRPLIYVYDLPPDYNTRLLQYRADKGACAWRGWTVKNGTDVPNAKAYALETLLHELLLQSPHRTLDAEEADFFYVPLYLACLAHPVMGWADHPWYYGPSQNRPHQMAMMALEAKRWLENHHPWWRRRGGADHVWLFTHDEASCYVPSEIYNTSIILSHWGRKDPHPQSSSAFHMDDYSAESRTIWNWEGSLHIFAGHPCYEPHLDKDLLLPIFKPPAEVGRSPLYGSVPLNRSTLLFFRGDFRDGVPPELYKRYSRFIRQTLRQLAKDNHWQDKYNIKIGTREDIPGDYDLLLDTSIFCLVVPGDGYSPRAEDAVLHGCIPVIIMDDVDPIFASVLDWTAFSVRIPQASMHRVPEILQAISMERVREMQINLSKVWHRFLWSTGPVIRAKLSATVANNRAKLHETVVAARAVNQSEACEPASHPETYHGDYSDDALSTMMAWLYHKLEPRKSDISSI